MLVRFRLFLLIFIFLSQFSYSSAARAEMVVKSAILQVGEDFSPRLLERAEELLLRAGVSEIKIITKNDELPNVLAQGVLAIVLGETALNRETFGAQEQLTSESFKIKWSKRAEGYLVQAVGGQRQSSMRELPHNEGLHYAWYEILQQLGLAFLHPLTSHIPEQIVIRSNIIDQLDTIHSEAPHWPVRGFHLHTMHPIELTHVTNGWGKHGPGDLDSWLSMLSDYESFLEWLVAYKQNKVEWVLLSDYPWEGFAVSKERQDRLRTLVQMGHQWGIHVGVNAPIALEQQNSFRLILNHGNLQEEVRQIKERIDWLMEVDFDFVATKMGFSEFHNPGGLRMLEWIDQTAAYLEEVYGRELSVKVHVSIGQDVEELLDPDTGNPLNFNFLTYYAHPRVTALPHTVQMYSLDDPAPTYGNQDFSEIRRYMHFEAGRRKVVWYPETSYWVSYDVDVPLFLPIYAERRLYDLRLIARDELAGKMGRGEFAGSRIQGQMNFSSGWEWGYWLNDVMAARGVWNPLVEIEDDYEAFSHHLKQIFSPLMRAEQSTSLNRFLLDLVKRQRELLILGKVDGKLPDNIEYRNGQAYLQGVEAWDDIGSQVDKFGQHFSTQPQRLGMVEMQTPLWRRPVGYKRDVAPLLNEMEETFHQFALRADELLETSNGYLQDIFQEFSDASWMTALRAKQIHALYDYSASRFSFKRGWRRDRLRTARQALDQALEIVNNREKSYRVDADLIAGWLDNPTAYQFGYLWTVRELFYWWRDEGKAVHRPRSFCYLNIIDPLDIAFGREPNRVESFIRFFVPLTIGDFLGDCLNPLTSPPNLRKKIR